MPVTGCFVAWQSSYFAIGGHFGSLINSGGFSKKSTAKIGGFALRKREKKQMAKVGKSCHQLTWAQKSVTKKRVNF